MQDNGGTANGGVNLDQTPNTITFNITAVNDAPLGNTDNRNAIEGTTTLLATVLSNDTDVEGSPLTASQFATNATGIGTQSVNGSNTVTTALGGTVVMNANGTFTYTAPARNHADAISDVDSFVYKSNDGSLDSAWTTVNITIADTDPIANNDIDSVGLGGTVTGNVVTGAGGNVADTLSADVPLSNNWVTGIVTSSGNQISSNTVSGVTTIVTTKGQLVIQQDGSYTYTQTPPANITVANPTAVSSFTNAGFTVYGFDGTQAYNTANNPNNGINLSTLNAAAAARVSFNGGGIGPDDDLTPSSNQSRIEEGEEIVIGLPTPTKSATITVNDLGAGEEALWYAYNASGVLVASGTHAGNGSQSFSITSATAFSYIIVASSSALLSSDEFRLTGISIAPEPSATPDVFTYTITDSDGDTASATLTMNFDTNTTAVNDIVSVSEAGINANGAQHGGTLEVSNVETARGNILANDTGVTSSTNITVAGSPADGNGVITVSDARGAVQIYTQDFGGFIKGDYVVTLTGKTTEGVNDSIAVNYTLTNSVSGEVDNATLTVNITDDVPIAESNVTEISVVPLPVFELFFMIDVSGSMTSAAASGDQRLVDANGNVTIVSSTGASGNATSMTGGTAIGSAAFGTSTLAQTRDAVKAVISKYFDESTNVSVKLGIFSTGARSDDIAYTSKAAALAAVDALTNVTGGTNYSAGLTALQSMFGTIADPSDGVSRIAYFITDGVPGTTTGNVYVGGATVATGVVSDGTNPAGSTGYQAFVAANKIESYAVAVGPAVPDATALNNVHSVDADASDIEAGAVNNGKDLPLIVSNISSLTEVLTATVPTAYGGNIGGAGGGASVNYGADGGYTEYIDILLDSADVGTAPDTTVRFSYNIGTNQITNNNNGIAGGTVSGSVITLSASKGFTLGDAYFRLPHRRLHLCTARFCCGW